MRVKKQLAMKELYLKVRNFANFQLADKPSILWLLLITSQDLGALGSKNSMLSVLVQKAFTLRGEFDKWLNLNSI